jgi:dihydroorotate dehydrogenase
LCGASLVQLYTSLTYEGPLIADKIIKGLLDLMKRDKIAHLDQIRGTIDSPEDALKIAKKGFN